MNTEIGISVARVIENVYAVSALDYINRADGSASIVGRDQSKAIERLVRQAAAEVIYNMGHAVTETNLLSEPETDIITISLELPEGPETGVIRQLIENALSASALAVMNAGHNSALSDTYALLYRRLDTLLGSHFKAPGKPGRIQPAC